MFGKNLSGLELIEQFEPDHLWNNRLKEITMYNHMLPQANVNYHQEKLENYLFDSVDLNVNYLNTLLDTADKFSSKVYTTYFNRVKNFVEFNVENTKQFIRTGKIEVLKQSA